MKRLSTYFFLIIIFGMGIASSISYLFRVDSYKLNNTVIKDTMWTVNDGSSIKINEEQSSIIKSYIQYMEEAIDVNLFLKQSFIEYYGIIQRLLHRNIVEDASKENDVYKLSNGSLALGGKVKNVGIGNQEGNLYNKRIISLKVLDSVVYETTGNHLYYISTPIKINDLNVPYHLLHTNLFKKYLNEIKYNTSIHFYDLDNDHITSGTRMFYFTDHHWRVEYVFSRMKDICHFLSVDSSCFETHNWQLINTKKIFRGSLANRVGDYFI